MTPIEIQRGLQATNRKLEAKTEELPHLVEASAQAKRDFQIAKAERVLRLKTEGMSVTLIPDLAKGDKAVADLEFKWAVAEGVCRACGERIKDLRESIGSYRSLLSFRKTEMEMIPTDGLP